MYIQVWKNSNLNWECASAEGAFQEGGCVLSPAAAAVPAAALSGRLAANESLAAFVRETGYEPGDEIEIQVGNYARILGFESRLEWS